MKRIISICLIALLLMVPVNVSFAEEPVSEKQSAAISLLNDLNIFQGVTAENAQETITRAKFAEIVARLMGGEKLTTGSRIYTDVLPEHESAASIEFLYNTGVMLGYGGAEFRPEGSITVEEAVKVAVQVIGYSNRAQYEGGWSTGYYSMAASAGVLRGVQGKTNEPITYANAAILIQNVLENDTFLVITGYKNGEPIEEKVKGQRYMEHMLGIYRYTGIVEGFRYTSLSGSDVDYGTEKCEIGGEVFQLGDVDIEEYFGMKVNAYYHMDRYDNSTLLHVSVDSGVRVIDADAENIAEDTGKTKFSYYDDGGKMRTLALSSSAIYLYNGKRLNVVTDGDLVPEEGSVRLICNSGSVCDVVIIQSYETFVADKVVGTEYLVFSKYDEGTLDFGKDSNILARYFMDGAETDFTSISSGSVLTIAKSKNPSGDILADVYISNNQITGTAKSVSGGNGTKKIVLDDGSEYCLTKKYEKRLNDQQKNTYLPEPGQEGTFYIDYFGRLAAFGLSAAGKNYAYVVKAAYNSSEEKGLIRLFTKDGEFITFEVANKLKINGQPADKELLLPLLKLSGENGTVNQLITYKSNSAEELSEIQIAEDHSDTSYYIAAEDEFVLNKKFGANLRFYKNMAEHNPFTFVDNRSYQFMIPDDKNREKDYKVVTKLTDTDVNIPAPIRIYDAGRSGIIGAMTTNTASAGSLSDACLIDELIETVDEEGVRCRGIIFVGGTTVMLDEDLNTCEQETMNSEEKVVSGGFVYSASELQVSNLKRGDVVQYATANNKVNRLRLVVKSDNVGPVRINGEHLQRSGNMVADVISVAENGRTALVRYYSKDNTYRYQTMLVNGSVYRYESSEDEVYNSSTADLREGDRILINSFWWSPKAVVIFR